MRANDSAVRQKLIDSIKRVARGVGELNGMAEDKMPRVTVSEGTPATINDSGLAKRLNAVMIDTFGADRLKPFHQMGMGAEDFSYLVLPDTHVRGYYIQVGGTPQAAFDAAAHGGPPIPSHHSPQFKIEPEPVIETGAIAMTAAVLDLLKPGASAS